MATAQKEIPIEDAELDDLMAQLEAETAGMVDAPVAVSAPAVVAAVADPDDQDIVDMEAEIAAAETTKQAALDADLAAIAAKMKAAPAAPVTPDPEDELAALAAEIDAEVAAAAPAPTPAPAPAPAVEPKKKMTALEMAKAARAKLAVEGSGDELAPLATPAAAAAPAPAPTPKPAPAPAPTPKPAPAPAPVPVVAAAEPEEPVVRLEGAAALAAVSAALDAEKAPRAAAPAPAPAPAAPAGMKGLNFYIDMAEFREEIKISDTNLDDAMMQQASQRAFHGAQAAYADAQHSRLKLRHKVVEARLYKKHRELLIAAGEKPTERLIESEVLQDPEYVASENRVIEGETIAAVRRACTDALRDKKDMLVQLGADRRQDGQGQLRILAENQHQDKRAQANQAISALRSA